MGFFEDLTKKATGIVSKGKDFLADQLSSETTYERDATGNFQMTSTTGNKPKVVQTAKDIFLSGRGYTDQQIKEAQPTTKETITGIAKGAGEIVQGGLTLTHMLGNKIADTILPGYDSEASASARNKINEKVSTKLAPKTAGEAKTMRFVDYAGFLPVGSVSKVTKFDDLIKASNKTDAFKALKENGFTDDAIRNSKLDEKIASASDEVAVQNVLKDVMPSVESKKVTASDIGDTVPDYYKAEEAARRNEPTLSLGDIDIDNIIDNGYKNMPLEKRIALKKTLNNRDVKTVTVYRASDSDTLRTGDFVALSEDHARSYLKRGEGRKLVKQEIPKDSLEYNSRAGDFMFVGKGSPLTPITKSTKQFDIPKKPTGEVDTITYSKKLDEIRKSSRGDLTVSEKIKDTVEEAGNKLLDFTLPITERYRKALKTDKSFAALKTNEVNINDNIDRVFNTPTITKSFIDKNGLSEAIQIVDDKDLSVFSNYLSAKHSLDLDKKGLAVGYKDGNRSKIGDEVLVAEFGPKFKQAEEKIRNYTKSMLEYAVKSNILDKKMVDALIEKHPNYVPSKRVFSAEEEAVTRAFNSAGVASLSKQTVVQKIKGSERAIESPLESLVEMTENLIRQGEKNKAALEITSYADIKGNPFGLKKITDTSEKAANMDTISVLRNGKKEIWEVYPDVAAAAKALDIESMGTLMRTLSYPMRVARLGITGALNVAFPLANFARDQLSAFVLSDNALRSSIANPAVFLKGFTEAIGHGKLYDEMLSEGALMTSFDANRKTLPNTVSKIASRKGLVSTVKYTAKNPSEWLTMVEDLVGRTEEITRIQQYAGNKQAALKQGMTEAQARNYAARAARENSTNFARRGEVGTLINSQVLYFNAGVQGSRRLVRALREKPAQTSTKIATVLMFPAATLAYWNLSDPKRKEAYDSIQEYERENNFIFVPPNPTKDEQGRWNVVKYPLPPGVGQFTNFVRRPLEAMAGLDPYSFAEGANNLLRVGSPLDFTNPVNTLTPIPLKGGVQAATNKNLFTGYDIVPQDMANLNPDRQYFSKEEKGDDKNTSGTVIDIANKLGVSPIQLEQFLATQTGAISPQLFNAIDTVRGEQVGGRSVSENISRRFTSAAGGKQESDTLEMIYDAKREAASDADELEVSAYKLHNELKTLPKEEANKIAKDIKKENPELYQALLDEIDAEKLQYTDTERALRSLPVKDGTRAKIIKDLLDEKKNKEGAEAANALYKELRKKKIISDEVAKQFKQLMELKNSEE
jgi:hypothetical protein